MRRAHVAVIGDDAGLRPRRGWRGMEAGVGVGASGGCRLGGCPGDVCRCVVGSRSHSARLVSNHPSSFFLPLSLSPLGCTRLLNVSNRDRPWQEYPITILTGAYIGFAVGSLIARTPLLFGKRIEFTSSSEGEETAAPQDHQNEPQ